MSMEIPLDSSGQLNTSGIPVVNEKYHWKKSTLSGISSGFFSPLEYHWYIFPLNGTQWNFCKIALD
jgi:hypothetical protein